MFTWEFYNIHEGHQHEYSKKYFQGYHTTTSFWPILSEVSLTYSKFSLTLVNFVSMISIFIKNSQVIILSQLYQLINVMLKMAIFCAFNTFTHFWLINMWKEIFINNLNIMKFSISNQRQMRQRWREGVCLFLQRRVFHQIIVMLLKLY